MKLLKWSLLLGLSLFFFSCDDDDDTNPKDANPIYFASDGEVEMGDLGEVYLQLNFDHQTNEVRVVGKLDPSNIDNLPTSSRASQTITLDVVLDFTLNATSNSRSDDYDYTINVDEGATYSQSLKFASGCVDVPDLDPGFSNGVVASSFVLEDFIQWDDSAGKYYIDSEDIIGLLIPDFDFGNPGNAVYPKIWQESGGSIKGCSELPTTF
ncbi:hypothetical protein [Flammeovirga sp. SubArs3]|uniref:hypothetical protein n=1 Tax=Flammeovirga sp. SubArs3 TaxID=2995316 RepID=UPI00248C4CC9|nr:hypothetical protein [Flammeovirga sp. SubArs3]